MDPPNNAVGPSPRPPLDLNMLARPINPACRTMAKKRNAQIFPLKGVLEVALDEDRRNDGHRGHGEEYEHNEEHEHTWRGCISTRHDAASPLGTHMPPTRTHEQTAGRWVRLRFFRSLTRMRGMQAHAHKGGRGRGGTGPCLGQDAAHQHARSGGPRRRRQADAHMCERGRGETGQGAGTGAAEGNERARRAPQGNVGAASGKARAPAEGGQRRPQREARRRRCCGLVRPGSAVLGASRRCGGRSRLVNLREWLPPARFRSSSSSVGHRSLVVVGYRLVVVVHVVVGTDAMSRRSVTRRSSGAQECVGLRSCTRCAGCAMAMRYRMRTPRS